jgi:hypothetical protein
LPQLLLELLPKLLLQLLPKLLLEFLLPKLLQLSGQLLRADYLLRSTDLLCTCHHLQLHASNRVRAGHQLCADHDLQLQLYADLQLYPVLDALLPADLQLSIMQLLVVLLLAFVPHELLPVLQLQVPQVSCGANRQRQPAGDDPALSGR